MEAHVSKLTAELPDKYTYATAKSPRVYCLVSCIGRSNTRIVVSSTLHSHLSESVAQLAMVNLSQLAATNLAAGSDDSQNPRSEQQEVHHNLDDDAFSFSPSPITLQKLPHLSEYLQDLQSAGLNPMDRNPFFHPSDGFYITPSDVILHHFVYNVSLSAPSSHHLAYHRAGPRDPIFFDPCTTRATIVTCGGLCPGMNTVIRELVVGLWDLYGVRHIYGIKADLSTLECHNYF
ncbi:hypothetical protein REPUB_Repub13aG0282700 [Reevesia pubescens]